MTDTTDLIARLRSPHKGELGRVIMQYEAADALEAQAREIEALKAHNQLIADANKELRDAAERDHCQIEALRADAAVWKCQVDSLRDALRKVLDTRNKEAKAAMSYQTARENYSDDTDERKAHERAMLAACDAEREARTLLLTLKDIAGKAVTT
jgi:hypothetical protein